MAFDLSLLRHKQLQRVDVSLVAPVIDFTISHVDGKWVEITFLSGDLKQTTWRMHEKHLIHKGTIYFSFDLTYAECINSLGREK